jgi:hypothetical protein
MVSYFCHLLLVLCVCCRALDKAAIKSDQPKPVTRTEVEETKAFLGIMPLFLCICIYQMAYVSAAV